jgi:hypothetical protein
MKAYIAGLIWAGIEEFLHIEAHLCEVDLTIDKVIGGIRRTYFYTIIGEELDVLRFQKRVQGSISQYNSSS